MAALHIIDTLGRGGAETCLVAGLPALTAQGVRTSVLTLGGPLDLAGPLRERGVEVVSVADRGWLAALRAVGSFDLVHTHLVKSNLAGRVLAMPWRRPLVATLHNADYGSEGKGRFGLRFALDRLTSGLTLPAMIAVSEAVRRDYEEHLHRSPVVIPNPVDLGWLAADLGRDEARRQLGLDARPVVFACARLHRQKGLDVLAEVAAGRPGVQFVVAGEGPERGALEARGSLRLLGSVDRPTMARWLAAADVATLPSRWEAFGVAAVEQMGAGVPLVVTDIGGLRETVGEAALRIRPDDVTSLGEAIDRLLGDDGLRTDLGARGRAQAALFGPDRWAERVAAVYRQLMAG